MKAETAGHGLQGETHDSNWVRASRSASEGRVWIVFGEVIIVGVWGVG